MAQHLTRSKIPLKQVYTPDDIKDLDYQKQLNDPGSYPYTRGRRAGAGVGWIQRELSGEGEPSRSNEQLKYLIDKGQMGIDVIGDSPTQACLDPDHPFAVNAVGTQGVSLCCLQDYRELYKDLPLSSISVSSSVPPAFSIPGLYLVAKENRISPDRLRGSAVQAPFYAEDCGYSMHMPFRLRLRLTTVFPKGRHCRRAVLHTRANDRTLVLGHEHFQLLPDGRQMLRWEANHPRQAEVYTLRWKW